VKLPEPNDTNIQKYNVVIVIYALPVT
jgi:hypothetical protein